MATFNPGNILKAIAINCLHSLPQRNEIFTIFKKNTPHYSIIKTQLAYNFAIILKTAKSMRKDWNEIAQKLI